VLHARPRVAGQVGVRPEVCLQRLSGRAAC
jgi:hypothetical protein